MTELEISNLAHKCRKIIGSDTARISSPSGKMMFLIIGFNKNTKNNAGQWIKNGKPFDFEYTEERVIASGKNKKELLASVKEYKRLCRMTMIDYLLEQVAKA